MAIRLGSMGSMSSMGSMGSMSSMGTGQSIYIYMESGTVGPHARAIASHAMTYCCEASSHGKHHYHIDSPIKCIYIYIQYACPHTQGGTGSEPTLRFAWAVGQHALLYMCIYIYIYIALL